MKKAKITIDNSSWEVFLEKQAREILKKGIVLDVGGGSPYQKELIGFTDKKFGADYFSLDYNLKSKPNITADAHFLPIKSKVLDGVILKSVLEHVSNPFIVVAEIYRTLKPGGKLLLWVPFIFPYHASGDYKDFYRFSRDGIEEILKNFSVMRIVPTRGYFETITNLLPNPLNMFLAKLSAFVDNYLKIREQHSGFGVLAIK